MKFPYTKLNRITKPNGSRTYLCPETGLHLPSVTTILGGTSDKTHLIAWKERIGEKRANEITQNACGLGSHIHKICENYLLGVNQKSKNPFAIKAEIPANVIINNGLKGRLNELYGVEIGLYYPGLYAGSTDCVGIYDNIESIIDFKGTKSIKKEEWITDYKLQTCAYGIAHNQLFNTNIKQGVILMVMREDPFTYKEFIFPFTNELKIEWFERLEQYEKLNSI